MLKSLILTSVIFLFQEQTPSDPCNIGHAGFPPPALPFCDGHWDADCLALCNWTYSDDMADSYYQYCTAMQHAWQEYDWAEQACEQDHAACLAAGASQSYCDAQLNRCLSSATSTLAKTMNGLGERRQKRDNDIAAAYINCVYGIGMPPGFNCCQK